MKDVKRDARKLELRSANALGSLTNGAEVLGYRPLGRSSPSPRQPQAAIPPNQPWRVAMERLDLAERLLGTSPSDQWVHRIPHRDKRLFVSCGTMVYTLW